MPFISARESCKQSWFFAIESKSSREVDYCIFYNTLQMARWSVPRFAFHVVSLGYSYLCLIPILLMVLDQTFAFVNPWSMYMVSFVHLLNFLGGRQVVLCSVKLASVMNIIWFHHCVWLARLLIQLIICPLTQNKHNKEDIKWWMNMIENSAELEISWENTHHMVK